ncbi:MAG TPA: hypothetical protein PK142_02380 [bacterium]|nr:hypothetical protein [bacterium]
MNFENTNVKETKEESKVESTNEVQDTISKAEAFEMAQADLASAKEKDASVSEEKKTSILEKLKNFFGEDPYQKEIKRANEFFKSLQYNAITTSGPGGVEARNGIDFNYQLEGDEVETFQKIIEATKQISKLDKGDEKVNLLRDKSNLIQELKRKVGNRISEKYNKRQAA